MKALFYSNGMDIFGPVSVEEFSKNRYYKSTLIWHEGLSGWVPIGDFQELKHLIGTFSTPSLDKVQRSKPDQTPPLSQTGKLPPPKAKWKGIISLVVILAIGSILPVYYLLDASGEKENQHIIPEIRAMKSSMTVGANTVREEEIVYQASSETEKKTYRLNWARFITALPNDYKSKDIGGIEDLKVSIKNNSPYLLDSVKVKVTYLRANGDVYQTETLAFDHVDPNGTKSLYAPNSNRGVKVNCSIVTLYSKAMDMCFNRKDKPTGEDPYWCK